jgi:Bacterial regulatory proteins, luxR family
VTVAPGHLRSETPDSLRRSSGGVFRPARRARSVAPSTVRKHLEHIFRKLGVTSRLAAVAALQGRDDPGLDLRERIDRFA